MRNRRAKNAVTPICTGFDAFGLPQRNTRPTGKQKRSETTIPAGS
jgi:hypothetical protein